MTTKIYPVSSERFEEYKKRIYRFLIAVNCFNFTLLAIWIITNINLALWRILVVSVVILLSSLGGTIAFLLWFPKSRNLRVAATDDAIEMQGGNSKRKIFYKDLTQVDVFLNPSGRIKRMSLVSSGDTIFIGEFFTEIDSLFAFLEGRLKDKSIVQRKYISRFRALFLP